MIREGSTFVAANMRLILAVSIFIAIMPTDAASHAVGLGRIEFLASSEEVANILESDYGASLMEYSEDVSGDFVSAASDFGKYPAKPQLHYSRLTLGETCWDSIFVFNEYQLVSIVLQSKFKPLPAYYEYARWHALLTALQYQYGNGMLMTSFDKNKAHSGGNKAIASIDNPVWLAVDNGGSWIKMSVSLANSLTIYRVTMEHKSFANLIKNR